MCDTWLWKLFNRQHSPRIEIFSVCNAVCLGCVCGNFNDWHTHAVFDNPVRSAKLWFDLIASVIQTLWLWLSVTELRFKKKCMFKQTRVRSLNLCIIYNGRTHLRFTYLSPRVCIFAVVSIKLLLPVPLFFFSFVCFNASWNGRAAGLWSVVSGSSCSQKNLGLLTACQDFKRWHITFLKYPIQSLAFSV